MQKQSSDAVRALYERVETDGDYMDMVVVVI